MSSTGSMFFNFISSLIIYGSIQKDPTDEEGGERMNNEIFYTPSLNNETESKFWWLLKYVDIDIDYARWLSWLFTPIILSFILPIAILFFLYSNSTFLYIYKLHRHRLINAYERDVWEGARKTLAAIWDAQGYFWHGYEVQGLENIPDAGGALLCYYHGALPIDFYYLLAKCILYKGRLIRTVGDRFLFKIPGFGLMLEAFKVIPGTVSTCSSILKDGHILSIAPGGVYEAQFGDEYYQLLWKKRVGFAKVALEAKVPILPMFTKNIRESFRSVKFGKRFWHWVYSKTRLPIVPIYGFFPCKMKTFIGKPIPYDPNHTPESLAEEVAKAIEDLIKQHQKIPGNIIDALLDRFTSRSSLNKNA